MCPEICSLQEGPYTGGSMNPARTLGPALAFGDFSHVSPGSTKEPTFQPRRWLEASSHHTSSCSYLHVAHLMFSADVDLHACNIRGRDCSGFPLQVVPALSLNLSRSPSLLTWLRMNRYTLGVDDEEAGQGGTAMGTPTAAKYV